MCIVIILAGILIAANVSLQEKESRQLEKSLQNSQGVERLKILVRLTRLLREVRQRNAIDYGEEALVLLDTFSDDKIEVVLLDDLCWLYLNTSDFDKAITYVERGIALAKKIDDKNALGNLLRNFGSIHLTSNNLDRALRYYSAALNTHKEINNQKGITKCYNNIGLIYWKQKKYAPALRHLKKNLAIRITMGDPYLIGNATLNLGVIYMELKEYKRALQYLFKAITILEKEGIKRDLSISYKYTAVCYKRMKKYPLALEFALKSLKTAKKVDFHIEIAKIQQEIAYIYAELRDFKMAYHFHREFKKNDDKMFTGENKRKILQMEINFQTENKGKKIELLKKEKRIQQLELNRQKNLRNFLILCSVLAMVAALVIFNRFRYRRNVNALLERQKKEMVELIHKLTVSESDLKKSIATKDKFFSILAHDLRNPISAFFESMEMLSQNYTEFDEEEIKDFIGEISISAEQLFNLLENLLQWSRTQKGDIRYTPGIIDLYKITKETLQLSKINADKKQIRLISEVPENLFCFADLNMITTVIRNLISNAIKFTEPAGTITVAARPAEDATIEVSVKDTGIGIQPGDIKKLFRIDVHYTTTGTSSEKGTGLGLVLCKEFTEKNKGSIRVASSPGKGSTFYINLPPA
ncbi:MAG: sensor histidine kinase [bacterium]|nr:sensor histidine kinase [bacterium]